jgi:hypothetical protein
VVYGRRRVGKTYLIRRFFGARIGFELTGTYDAPLAEQLGNFARALRAAPGSVSGDVGPPAGWSDAFEQLKRHLQRLPSQRDKRVVFIDELPWLASRKSGFLRAFEHFWNSWASTRTDLLVVVCGSAASWMTRTLLHARGGLHNRVTEAIRLEPFRLAEAQAYLESRRVRLSPYQVFELYLALGGVPHYLRQVEPGRSAAESINRLCFAPNAPLRDEFKLLYASLFEHSERHEAVVRALAKQRSGINRAALLDKSGLRSGGGASSTLEELEASGFITRVSPYGRQLRDSLYRLVDEYSLFYLRWMERASSSGPNVWLTKRGSPAWRAWSGYAFESVCLKHVTELKRAIGVEAVETMETSWHRAGGDEPGAQIDLVIDRKDGCINLCEMKFSESEYAIDKGYARELANKVSAFSRATGTRKALFLTMVTVSGVRENAHKLELVQSTVDASSFLRMSSARALQPF